MYTSNTRVALNHGLGCSIGVLQRKRLWDTGRKTKPRAASEGLSEIITALKGERARKLARHSPFAFYRKFTGF